MCSFWNSSFVLAFLLSLKYLIHYFSTISAGLHVLCESPITKSWLFLGGFCFHLLLIYLYTRWPVGQRTCTLAACSLGCLFLGCLGLCSSGSMDHSEPLKSRCWSSCSKISKESALAAPASKPSYPLKKMVRFFLNMLLLVKAFLLNISAPLQTSSLSTVRL